MGQNLKILSFEAVSTSAECDSEVADCGFTGDLGKQFAVMSEDGALVRIAWHDGLEGEDEGIIGISSVVLKPGFLTLSFDRTIKGSNSTIPYSGVEITYDNLDDRFTDLVEVFKFALSSMPERIQIEDES